MPPRGVAGQALGQVFPCDLEFLADEPQPQEPAPEGVLGVVGDGPCRAGGFGSQRLMGNGEAKLDEGVRPDRVLSKVEI